MGFSLAGLGSAVFPLQALSSLGTSAANLYGQREQRKWEENMSNSAYQRAVRDMEKAGLNPALMFGSGSAAGTPNVAPPTFDDPVAKMDFAGLARLGIDKQVADAQTLKLVEEASGVNIDNQRKQAELPVAMGAMERFRKELKLLDTDTELKLWSAKNAQDENAIREIKGRFWRKLGAFDDEMNDKRDAYEAKWKDKDFVDWLKSFFGDGSESGVKNGGPSSAGRIRQLEDNILKR